MTPTARVHQLTERVNALSLRERALLLLVVLACLFLVWDLVMMQPIRERQQRVQTQLDEVRERVGVLTASIQRLATERVRDPDAELAARQVRLDTEIAELRALISELHGGIAEPRQSITVLAGLLAERAGVTVAELENLPAQPLTGPAGQAVPGIFVHRVRVVIESDFAGVGDYLDRVGRLPEGVFWESMRLSVPHWPQNRVELVLYSLTFSDNWLGV